MALVGNLRDFGLSDFLYLVDRGYKTGMLVLQRPGDQARLFFQNGKLVYAIQNANEDRLGDLLLRAGKITPEQRDYALHLQQSVATNKPFGLILVELGYITREGIIRTVRSQIEETVYRLFSWTEGDFRFEPDVKPPRESVTIPLSIENVIMEGVRRIDEWSRIRDRIPTLDVIVRFADQPTERAKGVNLTPDEWRVFARINGADNIAAIARLTQLSEFDVCRIIYGFIQAGLVEVARPQIMVAPEVQARARALVEDTLGDGSTPVDAATLANLPSLSASKEAPPAHPAPVPVGVGPQQAQAPAPVAQNTVNIKRGVIFRIIERIRRI
jgi:hypothetical protein